MAGVKRQGAKEKPQAISKHKASKKAPPSLSLNPEILDMIQLLNELSNFVGIGSVELTMPRRAAPGIEAPDNWLWLELPAERPQIRTLELSLYMLSDLNVVRCTYRMVSKSTARVRVYCLPADVGRGLVARTDKIKKSLRRYMRKVLGALDASREAWRAQTVPKTGNVSLLEPDHERSSLFYIFNTMDSPNPDPDAPWIKNEDVRYLLHKTLNSDTICGMKTRPFKYQKRSIAMMIQRELAPTRTVDSRLKQMFAPSGEVYFLDQETCEMFEEPSYYDDVRGGILAEEMGTGKTLICLGVILSTQYQYARAPEEHSLIIPQREKVPSLMDLCVSAIWRYSVPWREHEEALGDSCIKALREGHGFYEIPPIPRSRSSRYTTIDTKEKIFLGSGTIIVCPSNLVEQWRSEITKHIETGRLKVLVLANSSARLPAILELLQYDILLFSRNRFDQEEKEGKDLAGRRESGGIPLQCTCTYIRASRVPNCQCFNKDAVYKSPLTSIRWRRLIVDEGHSMGAGKSHGVCVAERLPVEARWIVSGTPAPSLLGAAAGISDKEGETITEALERREKLLNDKKEFQIKEAQDLDRLGRIVRDFLRLKPWTPSVERGIQASWSAYITKGFTQRRAESTTCVHNILSRLMVRHRQEDIEKSVVLPPLYHKLVYLKPQYSEKLSINLFLGQLAVNAVTSERVDKDYIFEPTNRRLLRLLVNNLYKQGSFFWAGHIKQEVESTVRIAKDYLEAQREDCSSEDMALLEQSIASGIQALRSGMWNYFSKYQDMGYFISEFPEECAESWTLDSGREKLTLPLMFTAMPILEMQKHVTVHAYEPDSILTDSFNEFGNEYTEKHSSVHCPKTPVHGDLKLGIPSSSTETTGHKHSYIHVGKALKDDGTPKKWREDNVAKGTSNPRPTLKGGAGGSAAGQLAEDSRFMATKIVGTASTKLSYLLDSIISHQATEKTLVFYENDNVAWYIAQALEIFGVEYLSYQKNLPSQKKAQYIVTFNDSGRFRVLLMDLTQAAHGLNVCSASRVYFVNPVWTPSIEAQALKRAHRIGQTRPVYAETLILKGTLEEEMIKRRNSMSDSELKDTRDSIVNDSTMREVISNLKFLDVKDEEGTGIHRVAALREPQKMFGAGKRGGVIHDPEEFLLQVDEFDNGKIQSRRGAPSVASPTPRAISLLYNKSINKRGVELVDEPEQSVPRKTVRFC